MIKQYQLLTDWYLSSLENINDADGCKPLNDSTNSLEWIAGHLICGRYNNIKLLGGQAQPYTDIDKFVNSTIPSPRNTVAFDPNVEYSAISVCREMWIEYTDDFISTLKNVNESILKWELPFQVLTGGNTVEDALKFLILHETYHIGQMSIFRKALGYKPMLLGWRS